MQVLIIAHAAIRESNRAVYRRLATRGHDVTLLIPHRWKSVLGGRLTPEPEPPESPLKVVVRRRLGRSHSNLFFFPGGLNGLVSPERAAALYVDQDPAGLCAYQAARLARQTRSGLVILSIQNIKKKYPFPFECMQRYVFASAASALAVSRECETTIRARGFEGPVSIFNFAYDFAERDEAKRNATRQRLGIKSAAVGYVGRLVPEKGIDVFLRALSTVPHVTGIIAGDGPEASALQSLASELGISQRVLFTGNLSPSEAMDLIGALDVCVLPSLTRDNWKEQFGRVLVEAMAQGVPVVGSSSGAIPDTMSDAGIVFREGNATDLAQALERAVEPACREKMIAKGLARAKETFSVEAATDVLETALRSSIAAKPKFA